MKVKNKIKKWVFDKFVKKYLSHSCGDANFLSIIENEIFNKKNKKEIEIALSK